MSAHVFDASESDFEFRVLARSREVPVVVDFWASWCAPCRMLGPTLEREVEALGGRVELVKVDVDANQGLAGRFRVQGIPAVMAFRDGEVVDDFTGARDAGFVRRWLAGLSPSPAQQALAAAQTVEALRALVDDGEVGDAARLRLAARLLETGDAEGALASLAPLTAGRASFDAAEALRQRAGTLLDAARFGGEAAARKAVEANPKDLDARWALAAALSAKGEHRAALEEYLELVRQKRSYREDGARKAMVALFETLGGAHPLVQEYRRKLQVVL